REEQMAQIPNSVADILKSKTMRGLPRPVDYGTADVASHVQGNDNFHRVFAIRPGDHVVMLTDPLLDPRDVCILYGFVDTADGRSGRGPRAGRARRFRRLELVRLSDRSVLHRAPARQGTALDQDHLLPQPRSFADAAGAVPARCAGRDHPRLLARLS